MTAIEKICPDARGMVLVPENHTRNQYYLQNIAVLQTILRQAGINVRIGSLLREITGPTELTLDNGAKLKLEPLERRGNRLAVDGFDPCVVLLNNDLSAGTPEILMNLEQAVLPPLHAGWTVRRKSNHFAAYRQVAEEFAQLLKIDPWFINPYFEKCGKINFERRRECRRYVPRIPKISAPTRITIKPTRRHLRPTRAPIQGRHDVKYPSGRGLTASSATRGGGEGSLRVTSHGKEALHLRDCGGRRL